MALVAIAAIAMPSPASGGERPQPAPSPARFERQGSTAHDPLSSRAVLPDLVRRLPRATPLAIYFPHVDLAIADAEAAFEIFRALDPALAGKRLGDVISNALSLESERRRLTELPGEERAPPEARSRSVAPTPAALSAVGIDVGAEAIAVPSLSDETLVVAFHLVHRPRFEAWLLDMAAGEPHRVEIAGESASVLGPSSERPITCLARRTTAYCQVGASSGADPIAFLRSIVTLSPPTLDQDHGVAVAYSRLPEGAHAYALISIDALARASAQVVTTRARRQHRFDASPARRDAEIVAQSWAHKIRRAGELIRGVALGIYPDGRALRLHVEASATERGARILRTLEPVDDSDVIGRWSDTPALARIHVRTKPDHLERAIGALGYAVPENTLSGTFALLFLGIDPECAAAKDQANTGEMGWAFFIPSAIAAGVRGRAAADTLHRGLARALDAISPSRADAASSGSAEPHANASPPHLAQKSTSAEALWGGAPDGLTEAGSRPLLRGRVFGGTFEILVLDDVVLVGTGPGSGSAAVRRLHALRPGGATRGREAPLFGGMIDFRAIDAALEAGDLGSDTRPELRVLEAMRLRYRSLFEHAGAMKLDVRANEPERRVRVDFELRR